MTTFTASVEAQHADDLRAERDQSDADIRSGFIQRISDDRLAYERAKADYTRRRWSESAILDAVQQALMQARAPADRSFHEETYDCAVQIPVGDLDGVSITVTVTDLVATATVTVP